LTKTRLPLAAAVGLLALLAPALASAESLTGALASAYTNNSTLNAARAQLRVTDEGVPQAISGYRPVLSAGASIGRAHSNTSTMGSSYSTPASLSVSIEQPIFQGFRVRNSVREAEAAVQAGREVLRNSEQDVLLDAVTAYMNVVRDQAIVGLTQQNLEFLREQVRATQQRLDVGEGTRTDVAQAQASLATAESDYNLAVANLNASVATYVQVIGHAPSNLAAVPPISRGLPSSANAAVELAMAGHPAILAAQYNVDTAAFNVSVLEGALLPSVSLNGSLSHNDDLGGPTWSDSASVTATLSVPLYQGGGEYSRVRQAKEQLSMRRIEVDVTRDSVRALAVSAFGQLNASQASVTAANSGISASQLALSGVIEERNVGQRTTLDVLESQQSVLNARVALVRAQRDRVVASYTLLAATGRLSAEYLNLPVTRYQPQEHYEAVHDAWFGLRTPDGQ
jgi:outer membrane protein